MTASMLVESNPCWISEEMVLSERPSFRNRERNSGSTNFLGSTGKGVCGAVGGGAGRGAGSGVAGGGGAGVGTTCRGGGAAGAIAAVWTGVGGAGSGAAIERLGSVTGMVGGGGRG